MVKHIVDTRQLKDRRFLEGYFGLTDEMRHLRESSGMTNTHMNKVVSGFFYEPSTRTRTTFESAARRIGATPVFTENAKDFSSNVKGESLEHSLLAVEGCFDALVIRHGEAGAAARAAAVLKVPVINAGDGNNQHPTQSLLDIYTINKRFGRIDGLKVGFVGDIAYGRTIRSLAYLLAHMEGNELLFASPTEASMPGDMREYLKERRQNFSETNDVDWVIRDVDVLYVTRLQTERVPDADLMRQLEQQYREYQITYTRADKMRQDSIIMHPLPINTTMSNGFPEIETSVDKHPRAHYFEQSNNGLYARMALLDIMLTGDAHPLYEHIGEVP